MLSPGQWFREVPRGRRENLAYRLAVSRAAGRTKREQDLLLEVCRRDCLFFISTFVWQFNPNTIGEASEEVGPFIAWDFQDEAALEILRAIEERRDLLIEKSREMGASWLCLLVMLWLFLFHDWKKFLLISRDERAVDRPGDSDSLFWKLDFVLDHLPGWMVEGRRERLKLSLTNPTTHSSITGQASTGKAGVGGRATAMFIDEFSQIDEDYEVLHRTSDTTHCRIFNGTHRGSGTAFHELSRRVDIRKLVMHWSRHPDKRKGLYRWSEEKKRVELLDPDFEFPADYPFVLDGSPAGGPHPGLRSPWYDDQCSRKGSPRAVAMDLDVDPSGSVANFFDPVMIRRLIAEHAAPPYWQGDIQVDRDTGKPLALVARPGGPLRLWLTPRGACDVQAAAYFVGADVSAGTGATPSCLSGVNGATGEKVLEYADPRIDPKDFALVAVGLCRLFKGEAGGPARLVWEMQGPGQAFGARVLEVGFRNVYYRTAEMPHTLKVQVSDMPGWVPRPDTKRFLLEEYRAALATRQFVNRSEDALRECLAFRYDRGGSVEHAGIEGGSDPSGARVNHGDRTVADALAWMLAKGKALVEKKKEERAVPVGSLAWRRLLHAEAERASAWW